MSNTSVKSGRKVRAVKAVLLFMYIFSFFFGNTYGKLLDHVLKHATLQLHHVILVCLFLWDMITSRNTYRGGDYSK